MSITQRGRRFKKGVLYPILYEVSEKCEEEYWKQFFLDLSIGKNIRNITVGNGVICCTNKKKGFDYYFSNKTSDEIITELIPILTANVITCSEKHIKVRNIVDQVKQELEDLKNGKWSKIRRKNIKISLLLDFITEFQSNNNLNWSECVSIYNILSNNFNSHIMTKIIEMDNGKIQSIEGLSVVDGKVVFNHSFYCNEKSLTENEIEEENVKESFEIMWDSYVKRYFKNIRMMLS